MGTFKDKDDGQEPNLGLISIAAAKFATIVRVRTIQRKSGGVLTVE